MERKRAYTATLDDSDSSSSDEDHKTENSNTCFIAIHESDDLKNMDLKIGTHLNYIG